MPIDPAARWRRSPLSSLGRRFWLLFWGGLLSDTGSFATQTALVLHAFWLTGQSASGTGLVAMASIVPMVLAYPLGGVCAERYDRQKVMILTDLARIPLVLLLMVSDQLPALLALQAAIATCTALFMPARQAIVPALVPEEHRHLANTLTGGASSAVLVLGPVLGAFLYGLGSRLTWVVAADAASYLVSVLLLSAIAYRRQAPAGAPGERPSVLGEVAAGFRYCRSSPDLALLIAFTLMAGLANGMLIPLLRPFAGQVLGGGDATYAWLMGAFGLGGLVGPVVSWWTGRALGPGRTLLWGFLAEAALMGLWSQTADPRWSLALMFVWGAVVFTIIPAQSTYLQRHADPDYLGRTFAFLDQAIYLPQLAAAGLVALVGNRVPAQLALTGVAVLYLAVVLLGARSRGALLLRTRGATVPAGSAT